MWWGLLPADSKASNPQQPGRGGCGDGGVWFCLSVLFLSVCAEPRMPGACALDAVELELESAPQRDCRLSIPSNPVC